MAAQSPGTSSSSSHSRTPRLEHVDAVLLEARLVANKEYERWVT